MALEFERRAKELVIRDLGATLLPMPGWLVRPGKRECGAEWPFVCEVYAALTDMVLPDVMRSVERRTVDAVLKCRDGHIRVLEIDESQHFNIHRAATLDHYRSDHFLAFDLQSWLERSRRKAKLEGGGFAKPKPPLFPGENGRHRQRAFRDMLTDVIPPLFDFSPTLRIADFEAKSWVNQPDADVRMASLLRTKLT